MNEGCLDKPTCGTYSGYTKGCRGKACAAASLEYHRAYRARQRGIRLVQRLPFGPLFAQLRRSRKPSLRWLAERAGYSVRQMHRWKTIGVPEVVADDIAVNVFGVHPTEIWGDTWIAVIDEDEAEAS